MTNMKLFLPPKYVGKFNDNHRPEKRRYLGIPSIVVSKQKVIVASFREEDNLNEVRPNQSVVHANQKTMRKIFKG